MELKLTKKYFYSAFVMYFVACGILVGDLFFWISVFEANSLVDRILTLSGALLLLILVIEIILSQTKKIFTKVVVKDGVISISFLNKTNRYTRDDLKMVYVDSDIVYDDADYKSSSIILKVGKKKYSFEDVYYDNWGILVDWVLENNLRLDRENKLDRGLVERQLKAKSTKYKSNSKQKKQKGLVKKQFCVKRNKNFLFKYSSGVIFTASIIFISGLEEGSNIWDSVIMFLGIIILALICLGGLCYRKAEFNESTIRINKLFFSKIYSYDDIKEVKFISADADVYNPSKGWIYIRLGSKKYRFSYFEDENYKDLYELLCEKELIN